MGRGLIIAIAVVAVAGAAAFVLLGGRTSIADCVAEQPDLTRFEAFAARATECTSQSLMAYGAEAAAEDLHEALSIYGLESVLGRATVPGYAGLSESEQRSALLPRLRAALQSMQPPIAMNVSETREESGQTRVAIDFYDQRTWTVYHETIEFIVVPQDHGFSVISANSL